MSANPTAGANAQASPPTAAISSKGLSAGSVGMIGAAVIGISCIAPAYTLTAALGPTVSEVGIQTPAIILLGFIPMLLVAFGYRELNRAMPDSGTSFTWGVRAFGPYVGWLSGWGLIIATILVLSNLAGIAVDFFYLLLAQIFQNPEIAELAANPWINVGTCLAFIIAATAISYRDMQTTQRFQYVLVGFQVAVLLLFSIAALVHVANGSAFDATPVSFSMFNPFEATSISAIVAGLSLSIFIFWGWDVVLTMGEEIKGGSSSAGKAATITVLVIVALYLLISISLISFAGVGTGEFGLGNPDIQDNVFYALAGPVLGGGAVLVSIAVLSSSAASLQSTFVSPARTLLAMGYYGALPKPLARVHPRFQTPSAATLTSAVVAATFYAVMHFVSVNALWDTITALGMMVCFYYGLTAFSAVWYFRKQAFTSARNFIFQFLFPLVGGIILAVLFVLTLKDSMSPDYGSGSNIGGVGLVFILGVSILVLGFVVMIVQRIVSPAFFRGDGPHGALRRGVANDEQESAAAL